MKIAIAGYGMEGKASYDYWNTGEHEITIADERTDIEVPDGVKTILGNDAFKQLQEFDMVIRTASLPPRSITTNGKIWSATNEFFAKCPAQIIGVTGTKGKGTTCSMITSILKAAGKTVHLVGNIGTPALEILPRIQADDYVVYELSSFQLWDLSKSPHIAVILPIEPDHLDVHHDLEDYVQAKASIVKWQTEDDIVIYNLSDPAIRIASIGQSRRICYSDSSEGGAFVEDDMIFAGIYSSTEPICPVAAIQLPGDHNVSNMCAAITASLFYVKDALAIEEGIRAFTGLPHRLKFVAEKKGVKYYDDSISTTSGSAVAAVRSFFDTSRILILGGKSKGVDYKSLIEQLKQYEDLRVIAIGETGIEISVLCKSMNVPCDYIEGSMTEIVHLCASIAKRGSVVLLSPASASFDMFKNYADRGDQFVAAVNALDD